jgi:hypothetical protein
MPEALQHLERAAQSSDVPVRQAAQQALQAIEQERGR